VAEHCDVTIAAVRPGTHPQALAVLGKTLANDASLLACWYCEIGALNRILIIRKPAMPPLPLKIASPHSRQTAHSASANSSPTCRSTRMFHSISSRRCGQENSDPAMRCAAMCSSRTAWHRPWSCGAKRFRDAREFRHYWRRWSRCPARPSVSCISGLINLSTSGRGCATKPSPKACGRRPADPIICSRSRPIFICQRHFRRCGEGGSNRADPGRGAA
jgi:hypothetical protein